MAELDSAQQSAGVAPATAATSDAHMTQGRMSEVENALSVLQREAGLTEDTLKVLRKAVSDNLQPRSAGESNEEETGSRKRPFKPSSSKRQQLTADEAAEVHCIVPDFEKRARPCIYDWLKFGRFINYGRCQAKVAR